MKKFILRILLVLIVYNHLACQNKRSSDIGQFQSKDAYSNYVSDLEKGLIDIDYQDFRFSLLESEQFKVIIEQREEFRNLRNEMYVNADSSDYQGVIDVTKKMLSIDYTSMLAHKFLRQTYEAIGDTVNAEKFKSIQFGLLKSIVDEGDGQSCETAWPVIQLSEERFLLDMLGAQQLRQSIYNKGGVCDKIDVLMAGEEKTYFFDASKIFEYRKNAISSK